jgi:anti-anti-sigma factor
VARDGTVTLSGEYDRTSFSALEAMLESAARDVPALSVDMSEVTFLDASMIHVLMTVQSQLSDRGAHLVIRSPSRITRRVLGACGLDALVEPPRAEPVAATLR